MVNKSQLDPSVDGDAKFISNTPNSNCSILMSIL